jgi:hypothetical protein
LAEGAAAITSMNSTLYIIGNGFDLHHGIRSAYKQFGTFVQSNDSELYSLIENYFGVENDFWSEFEMRLADFDAAALMEGASDFLVSYGADDWSDSFHHDYQFELDRVVSLVSVGLRKRFAQWIRQLKIPDRGEIESKLLRLKADAFYLNFNYTDSLRKLYQIEPGRECHLHGSADDPDSELILGHAWNPADRGSSNNDLNPEEADTREIEGNQIIDRYFQATFKPTARVINNLRPVFVALKDVREVLVMGHSLAEVDHPYFKEILRQLGGSDVRWRVSYYGDDALAELRTQLERLGVPDHLIKFARLAEL